MKPSVALVSPAMLSKYLHPERKIAKHVRHMSTRIVAAIERGAGRIIVTMPPGHAKSDTISIHTPLWMLSRWPETPIGLVSYSQEKAAEWGYKVRNLIAEHQDKLLVNLAPDSTAKHRWNTPEGGGMFCVGIEGGLAGYRAGLAIVDDPVKNSKDARSKTNRDTVWEIFQTVVLPRLFPWGTVIVVTTRWNEDDLVGRLLQQQQDLEQQDLPHDEWEVINFPCLAEENDVLGRKPGEALWPEFGYDEVWAAKQKAKGSYRWSALFQQRPSPEGGSIFRRKYFRYFRNVKVEIEEEGGETKKLEYYELAQPEGPPKRVLKSDCWIFQTADTALEAKTSSDWTVNSTFAVTPDNDMLVLDVAREKLEVPRQLGFLYAQRDKWEGPGFRWQGVEKKASGHGLIQAARLAGRPFKTLTADRDKVSRSTPASVMYENGMVYHRAGAEWLGDFEDELLGFPNWKNDDQVDTVSYAGMEVSGATVDFSQYGWF